MGAVARKVAIVAGAVALVATGVGAFAAAGTALASTAGSVASYAAIASSVINAGLALTAKAPPAQGSSSQTTIGTDQPSPWLVGRTYYGGARVQIVGYGATLKKVKNPYLLAADVHSVGGPVDGLENIYADMAPVVMRAEAPVAGTNGYFYEHLWRSFQLGAQPEAGALPLRFPGAPGWGGNALLSGKAAIAYNALFDKDGEVFASGLAQLGAVWRGAKCWNPVADSTYPGGSGTSRWASPGDTAAHDAARATWAFTRSPGLLALRYALGIWERDTRSSTSRYRKTFGAGIPLDGLIVDQFVHLHNVCTANGWNCDGVLFEPTSSKWDNLKRILAAGGAEPCWVGGRLGVRVTAPRIALDTIRDDDLAEGEVVVGAMQGWEQRLNTIVPKYRSEAHRWEYVSTQPVQIATYLDEDGEEKREERQYDLVQDPTQARQLAAYELLDRRELGEIELPCKPRMRRYGPGDLLNIDLPALGLANQPAVVLRRSLDPATMGVTLVLRGETLAKHEFALGRTGTPPPTPSLVTTGTRDEAAFPVTLVDMGAYDPATTYREGHVVQDQGSSWVYINSVPSYGNPPPLLPNLSNAYWRVLAKAGEPGGKGEDGVPGEPGKDGQTWYPYYAYANSPDGSVDFTTGSPGDRTYVGFGSGTSPTEPASPSLYAWSEYKGPPFGIATRGALVSAGRQLIKNGGANEWDSDAFSTVGFRGGAVVSFKGGQSNCGVMAGLNTDPTADQSYTSIDYAWYLQDNGLFSIWENGQSRVQFGVYGTDTIFQIVYDGRYVIYYANGSEHRRVDHGASALFYFDSSFSTPGGRIYEIDFSSRGSNGSDGANGSDGIDGANGADGADGFSVDTETTNFVQPVFSTGANKPAWNGGSGTIRLNKGGQRITSGVTYAVVNNSGVASLTVSGDTFSFSGAIDDIGAFTIRATYAGQNYDKVVTLKKVYDGEAAFKGAIPLTNGSGTSSFSVPAGRQTIVSGQATYQIGGSQVGTFVGTMAIYWRNKTDNGPTNFLGQVEGTAATSVNNGTPGEPVYDRKPGTVSAAFSFVAPSPSKEIEFSVVVTRSQGNTTATILGTAGMEVRS